MQLETGQLHVAPLLPHELVAGLAKNKKIKVITRLSNMAVKITFNNMKEPYNNKLVRQALNYAVDKEAIAEHLYGGYAIPVPGVLAKVLTGWSDERGYNYNPELAKKLLAQAGYPNGFKTTIWTTSTGIIPKDVILAETVQKYWSKIGVESKIEKLEWIAIIRGSQTPLKDNKAQAFIQKDNQSSGEVSDALAQMCIKRYFPPNGRNRAFYSNPVVEELIIKGTSSVDVKKRDAYMAAAQILISEDAPWVPIITPKLIWAQSQKVHDMVFSPLTQTFANEKTWLEE
jgi:ABC-type transport system substrate-binding protein